jgi:hypothetical protein
LRACGWAVRGKTLRRDVPDHRTPIDPGVLNDLADGAEAKPAKVVTLD